MSDVAKFKDLCIDAGDPSQLGIFWGAVLCRTLDLQIGGDVTLMGATDENTIWINRVPEPKTTKNRVHLDVYTAELADLERIGADVLLPAGEGRRWTVMADPEGNEFCAFLREELPDERLHGLVVDCADPRSSAEWWGTVYGAEVVHHDTGYSTVQNVPGMPIETMDFVPVPEPKTVKNRIHWDVWVPGIEGLIQAGATVMRPKGAELGWYVMADPDGNEFCAFLELQDRN